jgi:2-polyprenyl-3-methyl-5-hydroxy-6-metoxy-1,4-benzoquinol methylase
MASISNRLRRGGNGIWHVDSEESEEQISYPDAVRLSYARVEDSSYWFAHRNHCIISVVRRHAPEGPIIDIGGGNGAVALALKRVGLPVIVVEPGAAAAQVARIRGLSVICGTFSALAIPDAAISAAGLFDVLEHVGNEVELLRDILRTLTASGVLYITVPALPCLWSYEDKYVGHFRRYTVHRARRVLSQAGFSVTFATYLFSPLVLPVLLFRSIPSLFGLIPNGDRELDEVHSLPSNLIGRWVNRLLSWEEARIARGASVPIGSSILLVARKACNAEHKRLSRMI